MCAILLALPVPSCLTLCLFLSVCMCVRMYIFSVITYSRIVKVTSGALAHIFYARVLLSLCDMVMASYPFCMCVCRSIHYGILVGPDVCLADACSKLCTAFGLSTSLSLSVSIPLSPLVLFHEGKR